MSLKVTESSLLVQTIELRNKLALLQALNPKSWHWEMSCFPPISCLYLLKWSQVILCLLQVLLRLRIHVILVVPVCVVAPGVLQKKKGGFNAQRSTAELMASRLLRWHRCGRAAQDASSSIHCHRVRTGHKAPYPKWTLDSITALLKTIGRMVTKRSLRIFLQSWQKWHAAWICSPWREEREKAFVSINLLLTCLENVHMTANTHLRFTHWPCSSNADKAQAKKCQLHCDVLPGKQVGTGSQQGQTPQKTPQGFSFSCCCCAKSSFLTKIQPAHGNVIPLSSQLAGFMMLRNWTAARILTQVCFSVTLKLVFRIIN